MSDYTDYMEEQFFAHAVNVREELSSKQNWMQTYESARRTYPAWTTKMGKEIKVEDVTDSHLNNILNFVPKTSGWHYIFECEKLYRRYKKEVPNLIKESKEIDEIMNLIY